MGAERAKPSFEDVPVAAIYIPEALRAVDPDWVGRLSLMIEDQGLQQAVDVIRDGESYRLIFGHHRLAAVKRLGHETIRSAVWEAGAFTDERLLRERAIIENVGRRDLSALDRAVHLREWSLIWEALHGKNRGGRPKKTTANFAEVMPPGSFIEAAKARTGLSERTIYQSCHIAKHIREQLRARIALTRLADNQRELDMLADQDDERQAQIVDLILDDKVRTVAEAIVRLDGNAPVRESDRHYELAVNALSRLDSKHRRLLLCSLRQEIMDSAFEEGWIDK